jgi:cytochrome c
MVKNFQFATFVETFSLRNLPGTALRKQARFLARIVPLLLVSCGLVGASGSAMASPEARTIMEEKSCGGCHIIPGVEDAWGDAGPSLKNFSKRERILANTVENNEENLRSWLSDTKAFKSGTLMPNLGLSKEEIEILIQYFSEN